MLAVKNSFGRFASMLALIALLTAGFVGLGDVRPAHAGTVTTDSYGTLTLPYSYSGTISSTDCANPARGAGYYGDLYLPTSGGTTRLYMGTGWDTFIQVLDSNKTTILSQDDDSGTGTDAYINSATVSTSQYVVATTFSAGGTGSYTLHSDIPLTQVTNCPQVITVSAPASIVYGSSGSMTASTNMSQAVTVTSQTPSVCTVASSAPNFTISTVSTGTCTLVSSQAGNGSIQAAATVTTNINIGTKALTIAGLSGNKNYDGTTSTTLTGTAALSGVVNSDTVSLTGTATGTYNVATAGVNTITVSGLSLTGAQASRYTLTTTFSGVISKIDQTISWSPTTALNTTATGSVFTAATTTAGGGAISYAVNSAGTTGCTVSGTTLSFTTAGTCVIRATAAATTNYNVATSDVSFVISKVNQTITWSPLTTLLAMPSSTVLSAATSSGTGAITYSIASAGTTGCTISGTTLTYTGSGVCQVTATAAANNTYNAATSTLTFTIDKAAQASITTSATNATLTYNASTPPTTTVSTSGGSGTGSVTYAVASSSSTVCSISGTTVTALTAGTCVIASTKAGDGVYLARTGSVTITVNKGAQSAVVVVASPSTINYSPSPLATTTLSATGGSTAGDVTFTVAAGSSSVCSITGNTLTALAAGSCVVTATKVGDANYLDRVDSTTITIDKLLQENFAVAAAETAIQYQSSPLATTTLSTSGGSGTGAISYLVQAGSNTVCSISGTTVTALTAGNCVITATKAADTNYTAATASVTIAISKIAQATLTLSAGSTSLTYRSAPALTTTISAAGGSGSGGLSYAVNAGSASVCSLSGTTVTVLTAGTCAITATKAADTNFDSASASVTIEVAKAVQAALVPALASSSINFSEEPEATTTISVSGGNGGGAVTYAPASASVEICSVSGNTITALSAGECVIEATKAESTNYLAKSATTTLTINKIAQTNFAISVTDTTLTYSAAPQATATYTISGGNGDGAVAVSVASGSTSVCSLSGTTVTILSAGDCVLNAVKAGSTNYLGTNDSVTISVAKSAQSILVANSTHHAITVTGGTTTSTLSYTGGSGTGSISWALDSSSVGICSLSGTTVTAVAPGHCLINLTKATDGNFLVATDSITLSVSAALQSPITISAETTTLTFSASDLTSAVISFSGGNGTGRVWFETSDSTKCVIGAARNTANGIRATVTALHAGACEVRGHKDGDSTYADAETELLTITVTKGDQSELSVSLESALTYTENPIASSRLITLGGSGSGNISYSLVTGNCTLENNELTAPTAGDCVVRATKAADEDFNVAVVETTFNIAKASQADLAVDFAQGASSIIAWEGKKHSSLTVSGGSGSGTLVVSTSSAAICTATISASTVTVTGVAAGACRVTVTKETSTNYLSNSSYADITVIDLPSAPNNLTITNTGVVTDNGTAVNIAWNPVASTGTQASATGYEVQFKSGLNWVRVDGGLVDADTTSLTVYPTPWTALYIRVAAVSDYDDHVDDRNWTNYTGTSAGTAPVAFNIAGQLDNISSPIVAATSGEAVVLTGSDFDQAKTSQVEITTATAVFAAGFGRSAVTSSVKTVPAIVLSPTKLTFMLPKVKLAAGQTQLAASVRILSTGGVRSEPVSFNYVPKKLAQSISLTGLPVTPNLVVGTAVSGTFGALGGIPTAVGTANVCSAAINDAGALTITPLAKGKCSVQLQAPATPGYSAAPAKTLTYTVAGAPQTITFTRPADRIWSSSAFDVTAVSSSNLPVVLTSSTPLVCSVSGVSVSMLKAGLCTLKAAQSGSTTVAAATDSTQSFTISKANRSANLTATVNSLSATGLESQVVFTTPQANPTQANLNVAIGVDPLDRVVTLSQREGTVLFTVDSADDLAGRCIADSGDTDSLEGVITLTNLGSCKVNISQPADDRFNAGASLTIWVNATSLNSDVSIPDDQDTGDGELSIGDTDINQADPDTEEAVAVNLPVNGGAFDLGSDVSLDYNPLKGLLTFKAKTAFVGTFKVTMSSPNATKKWFTVSKKPAATCVLTLTVKKDPKLKKSVVRVIGAGCTLSADGKAALTDLTVQKLKIAYVFNPGYAKTGLNYMGTAKVKTRILPKTKRTIVLKVGNAS